MNVELQSAPEVETCGCTGPKRRVCDLCWSSKGGFLACSGACLQKHLTHLHGQASPSAEARAKAALSAMNLRDPGNWDRYAPHRRRLMNAVCTSKDRGNIGVFGAGNCADVDIETLSRAFKEIWLIDLDGAAIERARDALPSQLRERTHLCGELDMSGFLARLDEWGEGLPAPAVLAPQAVLSARQNLQRIGRTFDVVLSTCVLSQLVGPYHRAWAMPGDDWLSLRAATTAVYLATLIGATRSGGEGFLAFDVLSSSSVPAIAQMSGQSGEELDAFVARGQEAGLFELSPDPGELVGQLQSPGLSSLVAELDVTAPWLWDIGGALQVVYGLTFRRA